MSAIPPPPVVVPVNGGDDGPPTHTIGRGVAGRAGQPVPYRMNIGVVMMSSAVGVVASRVVIMSSWACLSASDWFEVSSWSCRPWMGAATLLPGGVDDVAVDVQFGDTAGDAQLALSRLRRGSSTPPAGVGAFSAVLIESTMPDSSSIEEAPLPPDR